MRERYPTECIVLSELKGDSGTRFLELAIKRGAQRYLLNVSDIEYLEDLRRQNRTLEPEYQEPENILVLDDLDPLEKVESQLAEFSDEELQPYVELIPEEKEIN